MSRKLWLIVVTALAAFATVAPAQDPEEEGVRGSFLTSRPVAGNSRSNTNSARRTSNTTSRATTGKSTSKGARTKTSTSSGNAGDKTGGAKGQGSIAAGPIGLGYSLYLRDKNGDPVRVDPSREFHYKDSLRVSLEANTDGYLYVFYTENDNNPQMLFPDARLIGGDNAIEAHVPYEVPSSHEADPSKRWFVFDQNPAIERLYIVVSREPLPGIPTGNDLTSYCNGKTNCVWKPPDAVWNIVKEGLNAQAKISKSNSFGQAQTETEREATTRGLGLETNAPAPSVVRMNVSSNAPILVTKLELIHK